MISSLLHSLVSAFKTHRSLALENLALRQQLAVLQRSVHRPRVLNVDRSFWVLLRRIWPDWDSVLLIVKPKTVVRWHRAGFRRYWTWKSRRRRPGRPSVVPEVRELIRDMSRSNPLWDAPRVHGELMKLGISIHFNVTEHPSAEWTAQQMVNTFLWNTAPRYLILDRDQIYGGYFSRFVKGLGIEQVLTAPRSPWQSPYVERVIGSIRRECLVYVIVLN